MQTICAMPVDGNDNPVTPIRMMSVSISGLAPPQKKLLRAGKADAAAEL